MISVLIFSNIVKTNEHFDVIMALNYGIYACKASFIVLIFLCSAELLCSGDGAWLTRIYVNRCGAVSKGCRTR